MKFFLAVLSVILVGVSAGVTRVGRHHHMSQNVTDMIRDFGYPVQNFTVTTNDGYMLDVIRVPGPRSFRTEFENKQREHGRDVRTDKPVVILWHAMLSSCEDFVIGGPSEGLAFVLAENGYDVFMANTRGSRYARKHTSLNPEKDAAFWRFCFQEVGKRDLPAVIDAVRDVAGVEKVFFVGHMEGSTPFFVMNVEMPEYNDKIEMMVALGPMAFMKGSTNEAMRIIADNYESKTWVMKNMGVNEFHPSTDLISQLSQDCVSRGINERICQNPFFLINGYGSQSVNTTTIEKYMYRLPASTSTRYVMHFAQLIKTGRFESFDEQSNTRTEYDLSKITTPISMFYASEDKLVSESDVESLATKMPCVSEKIRVSGMENNLDLLFGQNVRSNVYNRIMDSMKRHQARQH